MKGIDSMNQIMRDFGLPTRETRMRDAMDAMEGCLSVGDHKGWERAFKAFNEANREPEMFVRKTSK